jgi:hypothetical protein
MDSIICAPHYIQIKLRRMRRAGHVARMGEMRNEHKIFIGTLEGKRSLRRPRRRRKDNIKVVVGKTGWESMDWIHLAQDREWLRAFVITVMKLQVLLKAGVHCLGERLLASQEGFCSMELGCEDVDRIELAQDR